MFRRTDLLLASHTNPVGALRFSVVATPLAVLAVGARFAEVLLPMVIFPLVTPILIAGVKGTSALMGTTVEDDPTLAQVFLGVHMCVWLACNGPL